MSAEQNISLICNDSDLWIRDSECIVHCCEWLAPSAGSTDPDYDPHHERITVLWIALSSADTAGRLTAQLVLRIWFWCWACMTHPVRCTCSASSCRTCEARRLIGSAVVHETAHAYCSGLECINTLWFIDNMYGNTVISVSPEHGHKWRVASNSEWHVA